MESKTIINAKASIEEREILEKAAKIERRSLSSFLMKTSLDKDKEILETN
jgi:uncharacterized protein (DUF1778 family)